MGVVARDSTCLITDVMYSYCTACHIVPLSRPDVSATDTSWTHPRQFRVSPYADMLIPGKVYRLILGINRDPPLYKTSAGLLLRDDLHHAYDRLEWSLYYKVSSVRGQGNQHAGLTTQLHLERQLLCTFFHSRISRCCKASWYAYPTGTISRPNQ